MLRNKAGKNRRNREEETVSPENEKKTVGCGCGDGDCCGGGKKPCGLTCTLRVIGFLVLLAAAAILVIRGLR